MDVVSAFEVVAQSLVGEPISHIWRGHGTAVFIEIGELTPSTEHRRDGSLLNPSGRVSLGVEWSWRIQDRRSILCGSWSNGVLWSPTFDRLRQGRVKECRLFGTLPEIELATDEGLRFVSFSTTDGQPQWFLTDKREQMARSFSVQDGKLHIEV